MRTRLATLGPVLVLVVCLVAAGCGTQPGSGTGSPDPVATDAAPQPTVPGTTFMRTPQPSPPSLSPEPEPPPEPNPDPGPVLGADISWPQCPRGLGIPQKRTLGLPPPLPEAEYVIVGLTNGPGFVANPCLGDQVVWVRSRGLLGAAYSVASFPDDATVETFATAGPFDDGSRLGALRNTGYQQARFNVTSMLTSGLETPIVWIDVEPVPDFAWSTDPVANAAVVEGIRRGYTDAGYRTGVYSTPYLWTSVVGDLALEVPEWRAAGETSRAEALDRCGPDWSIQGGRPVLAQWLESDRDQNVTCPGIAAELSRWFHQY